MKVARALGWKRFSAVQRSLVAHIILTTLALSLGSFTEYAWVAALGASIVTLWTVSRLLAHPTPRTIAMRSLEPLLIIWGGLLNIQLVSRYIPLDAEMVTLILTVILLWQSRFFLVQFDPARHEAQSLHTIMLMWLSSNALALLLLESPAWLPLILAATWLTQYSLSHFWLERIGFHNSFVPAAWALLVTQLVWLASFVMITYQLPMLGLLVMRSGLMIIILAYAWGSLLRLHSQRSLTKKLVVEYGMICSLALGVLIFLPAN